ncbi:uncharacterized protein LOC105687782 isoform X2 [Athalia rosae]|nr:uncharacterized protein LOC105687782 isoform X2 [Athalia rosae]
MNTEAIKVSGYIRCALMIIVLVNVVNAAVPQDRIDSQILDPFVVDVKAKRPFCNAFTGCGRKRSSPGVGQNFQASFGAVAGGSEGMKIVRLPLPLYRALLRAASQEMNNQIDQSTGDYRLQDVPIQEFEIPAQKLGARDQYES